MEKKKLFVGTPMHGGMCYGVFAVSCMNLISMLHSKGIEVFFCFLYDDALVPRARNNIVHQFLNSDCTHLLFIDGDIEFNPEDVMSILDKDDDIISGPYPKKSINWQKVSSIFKQYPDVNPGVVEKLASDYVFYAKTQSQDMNKLFEVEEAGTGFMMIRKNVFIKMIQAYPQLRYKTDDGGHRYCFFSTVIDNQGSLTDGGTDRYLSEDYTFCLLWKKIGGKIMMAPWISLNHIGNYSYTCDFKVFTEPDLKNETF